MTPAAGLRLALLALALLSPGAAAQAAPEMPRAIRVVMDDNDDEEVLARLGQKTLAALGYEVEVATQPVAALAMVRADPQRFALVFTDLTMPGMTGLALATRLRQVGPGCQLS